MRADYVKTPYYSIVARSTKKNITQWVDSIIFEESVGENDVLTLNMRNIPLSLLDEQEFNEGVLLDFHFGYLKGANSGVKVARVTNIEASYDKFVSMTIKALDLGITLRKGKKNFGWKDVSIKSLAQSIAQKNGLELKAEGNIAGVDELERQIQYMPQINETDFNFLKKTLGTQGTGDFIVFTKDDKLIIKSRGLDTKSRRTFTWNSPNDSVLSFKPTVRDTSKEEASAGVTVEVVNPETGEIESSDTALTKNNDKKTGDKLIHYDVNGFEKKNKQLGKSNEKVQTKNFKPVKDKSEAESVINEQRIEASLGDMTATLVIEGDPSVFSDNIITMANVAKKHAGNWYVHSVKHNIGKNGYITELELGRNAGEKSSVDEVVPKEQQNTEAGKTETEKPKADIKDVKYDVDGFRNDKVKVNSTQ